MLDKITTCTKLYKISVNAQSPKLRSRGFGDSGKATGLWMWSSLAAAGLVMFRTLSVINVSSLKHVHANLNEEVHIRGRGFGMVLHFFIPRRQIFGGETSAPMIIAGILLSSVMTHEERTRVECSVFVSWARGRTPGLPASNGDRLGSQWHGCHVGDHNLPTLTAFLAAREPLEFESSHHCDSQVCGRPPAARNFNMCKCLGTRSPGIRRNRPPRRLAVFFTHRC
jgi:hypothetical protein